MNEFLSNKISQYYNPFKILFERKIISFILTIPKIYFYDENYKIIYFSLPMIDCYIQTKNKNDIFYLNRTFNNYKDYNFFILRRIKKIFKFYVNEL
jgi:hypothetical protein